LSLVVVECFGKLLPHLQEAKLVLEELSLFEQPVITLQMLPMPAKQEFLL
jgi:hypothetical protein